MQLMSPAAVLPRGQPRRCRCVEEPVLAAESGFSHALAPVLPLSAVPQLPWQHQHRSEGLWEVQVGRDRSSISSNPPSCLWSCTREPAPSSQPIQRCRGGGMLAGRGSPWQRQGW